MIDKKRMEGDERGKFSREKFIFETQKRLKLLITCESWIKSAVES